MKLEQMFKGSKYKRPFIRVYSIASVLGFASLVFVFSMLGGFFHDAVGTVRWQHLVRIIIFADSILIISTFVIVASLVVSAEKIWKKIFIGLIGLFFVTFFFSYFKGGIHDLKNGIQTYEGSCQFEDGDRDTSGELQFGQIIIGNKANYKRLDISLKTSEKLEKTIISGDLVKDGRLFYSYCKHPIKVTYLYGLGQALTVDEDPNRILNYPQR